MSQTLPLSCTVSSPAGTVAGKGQQGGKHRATGTQFSQWVSKLL